MSEAQDLLIELGVEELPAAPLQAMSAFFGDQIHKALTTAGLASGELKLFATPRRLAVWIKNVDAQQPQRKMQKRGPALQAAFDEEGNPTKALLGFARSCGVDVDQLTRLKTDKGEWMAFEAQESGQPLASIISAALPQLIKQMPMPKRMRWSDQSHEFLRPVAWLVVLHGNQVLPVNLLGLSASRYTQGHRFHCPEPLSIVSADSYEQLLNESGYVMPNFASRRDSVRKQVEEVAKKAGANVNIDADLLDEVTALVEWPVALHGHFESDFLRIPKEALIQTMEENQRYFALFDAEGQLQPGFITVANLESSQPDTIRLGNERVIRPRFQDTMFFWDNDVKKKLLSLREDLQKVLFQEKLGSVFDKTERLRKLCAYMANSIGADAAQCDSAAQLAKCDLLTEIVSELPKMQGIAGRYYAELENYPPAVAQALEQQYWPKKAGGELPVETVAQVLSLADKTDTLTGIFGIGLKPTGAKDPFALRRASLGLLRILIEKGIDLDLKLLIAESSTTFTTELDNDFQAELLSYILERLKGYYQDKQERLDVVEAVLAKDISNPLDIDRRVTAMSAFRKSDAAASLAAANKRIQNILKKNPVAASESVNEALFEEGAERQLAAQLDAVAQEIESHYAKSDYAAAMTITAKLRDSVDKFFDDVMVLVENKSVRQNRLALLNKVGELCSRTADLSLLQPETVDRKKGVRKPDEWNPLPGSLEAIAALHQAGYHVAVATNQSGVARGLLELEMLFAIHRRMHESIVQAGGYIDTIVFCPHSDANECDCRKPKPGMLYKISERLGVELPSVYLVGDSLRDLQAAMAAGAKPILVKTGKGEHTLESNKGLDHIPAYDNLAVFVEELLAAEHENV